MYVHREVGAFWEVLTQEAQALAHGNGALEQEGPYRAHSGGAWADQACANPMQRLQVELVNAVGGHKAHGGTLNGLGHGFHIPKVILLALEEGLHELPWNQLHVVAKGKKLPARKTGTDAGFHINQARVRGVHVGRGNCATM
jgi:hypothetical protein